MEEEKPKLINLGEGITKKETPHAPHYFLTNDEKREYLDKIRGNTEIASIMKAILQRWQEKNPEENPDQKNDTEHQFDAFGKKVLYRKFYDTFKARRDLLDLKKSVKNVQLSDDEEMELAELNQFIKDTADSDTFSFLMDRKGMNVLDLQMIVFDAVFVLRENQGGANVDERKVLDTGLRGIVENIHTTTYNRVKWETLKVESLKVGDIVVSGSDARVFMLQRNGTYREENSDRSFTRAELRDEASIIALSGDVIHMVTPYDLERLKIK